MGESDPNDNCSSAVSVVVTAPELIATDMLVSSNIVAPSEMITLTATLRNTGARSSATTTLRWYRSTDSTIDTNDTQVATDALGSLAAGGSDTISNTITVPSTPDTYYYGVCIDTVESESDPSNNCSSAVEVVVLASDPELIFIDMMTSSTTVAPSEMITLTATLRNTGARSSDATTLRWYRSTDSTIDTNDTEVATNALGSLASSERSNVSISITVPNTAGTNYYGACVDPVTSEYNPINNCSSAVRVVVTVPELIVSISPSHTNVGLSETITLTAIVSNTGARSSDATTLRWYLSTDTNIATNDTQVGTSSLSSLAAGTSSTETISITVSNIAGTYTYGVCVDPVTHEGNPNDNCSSAMSVIATAFDPDLIVANLVASNTISDLSNTTTLTVTVRNTGTEMADPTTLRWYHSTNSTPDTNTATQVGTSALESLSYNESSTETISITIPNTVLDTNSIRVVNPNIGTNYYFACVDTFTSEYDLNNNCSSVEELVVILGAYLPARDFNTLTNVGNTFPGGLWSDGTTMWVADDGDDKIYAYDLATKERNTNEDFNTLSAAGNNKPTGIWSDGTTMWVVDDGEDFLYAYNMSNKAHNTNKGFPVGTTNFSGNRSLWGLWSDGTTIWVANDFGVNQLHAYDLATKDPTTNEDFDTLSTAGNTDPQGIWSDGTTMWVADYQDDKLFAYDLATKARVPAKDFNTPSAAGNGDPVGIWSDGTTMWVADYTDDKIYAYDARGLVNTGR